MEIIKKQSQSKIIAKRNGDAIADAFFVDFKKNTRICGLTNGKFSLISLIHSCLKVVGKSEVTISTWSAGFYDATVIKELINSNLISDIRIVLDRSFATRQKNYSTLITDLFSKDKIRTTDTHAKFVLIKNKDYNITIRSSMNLNENKRCENFDLDDDIEIYTLFDSFVCELFESQNAGIIESRSIIDPVFDSLFSDNNHKTKKRGKREKMKDFEFNGFL